MGEVWLDFERAKIRTAAKKMLAETGEINQRKLARLLVGPLGRSLPSIYGEIRRMDRTGGWWSHIPIGHSGLRSLS